MLLERISLLPNEIKEIIYKHISKEIKSNLTKKIFIENYKEKIKRIPLYESYIRYVIRNDLNFIFSLNIINNYCHWFNLKNWKYSRMTFKNYIYYIKWYARKQEKNKIIDLINIETNNKLNYDRICK